MSPPTTKSTVVYQSRCRCYVGEFTSFACGPRTRCSPDALERDAGTAMFADAVPTKSTAPLSGPYRIFNPVRARVCFEIHTDN